MSSYPKEHPVQFLYRFEKKRSSIINIYESDGMEGHGIDSLVHKLDHTLVTTLVSGVHRLLRSHVNSFQIQDLDDARDILLNGCRMIFSKLKYNRFLEDESTCPESYTQYSMS